MCMTCWYLNLLTIYRWCYWFRRTCLRVGCAILHWFWHCFWGAYNIWISTLLCMMVYCLTVRYALILFHILVHNIIDRRAIGIYLLCCFLCIILRVLNRPCWFLRTQLFSAWFAHHVERCRLILLEDFGHSFVCAMCSNSLRLIIHVWIETHELLRCILSIHLSLDAWICISAATCIDFVLRLQHCGDCLMMWRFISALRVTVIRQVSLMNLVTVADISIGSESFELFIRTRIVYYCWLI